MTSFKELGISHKLLKVLEEIGFKEPTEIQEKVIPLALAGNDIIGESATGSGKTLAFGTTILEKVEAGKGLQALILTPTRELAEQVSNSLEKFSKYNDLKIIPVYGGVSIDPQISYLEEADVVVGTPGRILDHISRKTINFSKIRFLVLDEADRMLDMGFLPDVTRIIGHCPKERQTFLFSATITGEVENISKKYMINPVEVSVNSYVDPSKLDHVFYEVAQNEKFSLLVHLLKNENSGLVMVFCSTKRNTDFIGKNLRRYDFDALPLHGDLTQNRRKAVLEEFHKSKKFILVCTDVAARGLDIQNVSHVYNYDSPKTSEEYIHRVGRTARAGKEGKAITLLSDRDYDNFRNVSRNEEIKIKRMPLPEFEKVFIKIADSGRGGFGSRRGGFSDRRGYGRNFERPRPRRGEYSDRDREDRRPRRNNFERRDEPRSSRYGSSRPQRSRGEREFRR